MGEGVRWGKGEEEVVRGERRRYRGVGWGKGENARKSKEEKEEWRKKEERRERGTRRRRGGGVREIRGMGK